MREHEAQTPVLRDWLLRYPGLTMGPNFVTPAHLEGIRTVGWFTLLGAELTAQKGGLEKVRVAFGDSASPLGDGVLIQAGDRPRLESSDAYHEVGRFLADVHVKPAPSGGFASFGGGFAFGDFFEPHLARWVSRFC